MSSTSDVENQQDRKEQTPSSPVRSELRGNIINVDNSKDDEAGPSSSAETIYKPVKLFSSKRETPENVKKYREFDPKVCHDLFILDSDRNFSVAEGIGGDSMLQEIYSKINRICFM
jgi:hypothetical protein